jgi:hypothetical protein
LVRVVGLRRDGVEKLAVAEQGRKNAIEQVFPLFPEDGGQFVRGERAEAAEVDGQLTKDRLADPLAQDPEPLTDVGWEVNGESRGVTR